MATLLSGYNRFESESLDGLTVGSVRSQYAEAFGIPDGARSSVNGTVVSDDFRLSMGDTLVFDQPTGAKGVTVKVA